MRSGLFQTWGKRKLSRFAAVGAGLLMASMATAACSASSDSLGAPAASTSASPRNAVLPPGPAVPQCPIGWNFCFTGYNNAMVFVGPGQVGSSVFQLQSQSARGNPFPSTWSGPDLVPAPTCPKQGSSEWCAQYSLPHGLEENYSAVYSPPDPFSSGDTITLSGSFSTWTADKVSPGSSVKCDSSTYTICTVVNFNPVSQEPVQGQDYVPASAQIHLSNLPVIIKIKNHLPAMKNDSLILSGQAEWGGNFLYDPNGGNPTTIDVGQVGYFGGYLPISATGGNPSFIATYKVDSSSTDLQGWSFTVSAQFNPDGSLASVLCKPNQGTGTAQLNCSYAFEGGGSPTPSQSSSSSSSSSSPSPSSSPQSGMQRLTFSIHE